MRAILAYMLVFPSFALAWQPKVGDKVTVSVSQIKDGQIRLLRGVSIITALDKVNDLISWDVTYSSPDTPNLSHRSYSESLSAKRASAKAFEVDLKGVCPQIGGVVESVRVPAGTFTSCRLLGKDMIPPKAGFQWSGDVVGGVIKADLTDRPNGHVISVLESQAPAAVK